MIVLHFTESMYSNTLRGTRILSLILVVANTMILKHINELKKLLKKNIYNIIILFLEKQVPEELRKYEYTTR